MNTKGDSKAKSLRRLNNIIIAAMVLIVAAVLLLNGSLFYRMVNEQTDLLGREQLDAVSSRLQLMLRDSEIMLRRISVEAEDKLREGAGKDEFYQYLAELRNDPAYSCCKNIYIATEDWYAVPDLINDASFDPKERIWFQGARKKGGRTVFISSPYLDVVTGSMCYTVSMLLEDRSTVVGVDFDMDSLREKIAEVNLNGGDALLVSSTGQIICYTDEKTFGGKLSEALPQYTNVFQRIISSGESCMYFNTTISGTDCTVFYSRTENDWYLISTISNWELYKDSYFQLIRNSLLNILLVAAVITMYIIVYRGRRHSERTLKVFQKLFSEMSDELRMPISTVKKYAASDTAGGENTERLKEAAQSIDAILTDIAAAAEGAATEAGKHIETEEKRGIKKKDLTDNRNRMVIIGVIAVLVVTMAASILLTTKAVITGGDNRMRGETELYVSELNLWMTEQKSTIDMFAKSIAADPSILDSYDRTVKWLDDITCQYDDISVTYVANPEWSPSVVMNNRWTPPEGWKLEERPWYIDTINSEKENGFSLSAPYFDSQTGLYCITFSERIYDRYGEFLGVFAADFYLDKLTQILSESYTDEGYAFLADSNGQIINHPNKDFELSSTNAVSLEKAGYLDVFYSDGVTFMDDYDGVRKAALALTETTSGFTVINMRDRFVIYGGVANYNTFYLILFGVCIGSIIYILWWQMKWQRSANRILRESADIAERAGRAKSQFLAQMSHEIRTPINAVLGMNEMILRESSDGSIKEYAVNIENAGRTLLSLINSILDFSKIEDGKMEIVPVNYDTAAAINDLVNMISARAEKKGLELHTEIDPNIPRVLYGDDVRVRQVVTNLLTNAVKYTETGSVYLRMSAASTDGSSVTLHIEVEDTGIGIKAEDMDGLFRSFQRLDVEKNRNIEGTGLGMSIVSKLLLMMNSKLMVESVYGEGSRFWFDIVQGVVEPEGIGNYTERLLESSGAQRADMYVWAPEARILIVDDNDLNLVVAKGLLKRNGMKIDTASSGRDGIKLAEKNFYDIIFLDHMMPELSGIDTLKLMNEGSMIPEGTAVVMMTANAIVGAREEYLRAGFDDYLSKPIDVKQMEKLLVQYIPEEKRSFKTDASAPAAAKPIKPASAATIKPAPVRKFTDFDKLKLIPELDTSEGLRRCMDEEGFYIKVVRAYLHDDMYEKLDYLFASGSTDEYKTAAKKLAESSRNIGAVALSKSFSLVLTRDTTARGEHAELLKSYRRVLNAIGTVFESN